MVHPAGLKATSGARRSSNEATEATERKIVMIYELLTQRRIRFSNYATNFSRDYRSFQRDLQQLRKIGEANGFALSNIKHGEYVELLSVDARGTTLNKDANRLEALLATMAQALGEPIVRQFGPRVEAQAGRDDFFSFVAPKLIEGTAVADTCALLRDAYGGPTGRAKVRFRYPDAGGAATSEREVEPYGVVVRSGMFYLLGYDCGKRGWRMFALDRFASKPKKSGSCTTVRAVPANYRSDDVIGFIRGSKEIAVTVELSARLAPSAIARQWQGGQRVEKLRDGRALIAFVVSDIDEVIRWSLGYGAEARVVAPPAAVARAAELIEQIAAGYRSADGTSPGADTSPAPSKRGKATIAKV